MGSKTSALIRPSTLYPNFDVITKVKCDLLRRRSRFRKARGGGRGPEHIFKSLRFLSLKWAAALRRSFCLSPHDDFGFTFIEKQLQWNPANSYR